MKTTHTEFERYYQQVRSRQKRDAVCWSLLLLALYFAAGSAAEFNLLTIWHSLPHFFDYMAETIPPLSAGNLFADVQTKGSLAWWGYRLPIQLPLIWETLQLALASTLDQTVLRGGGKRAKQTGTRPGGLRRVPAAENSLRPLAASETAVSLLRLYAA